MAMIATDIKGMLSIKIKPRNDSYTDQYNRIFMVKILLVCCVIMGISWFNDSVKCLVPGMNFTLVRYTFGGKTIFFNHYSIFNTNLIHNYAKFFYYFISKGVNSVDGGFVSQACWIQGVYVYKELMNRPDDVAYFGIPRDMDHDGKLESGELCAVSPKFGTINKKCTPMQKTFFLQVSVTIINHYLISLDHAFYIK